MYVFGSIFFFRYVLLLFLDHCGAGWWEFDNRGSTKPPLPPPGSKKSKEREKKKKGTCDEGFRIQKGVFRVGR